MALALPDSTGSEPTRAKPQTTDRIDRAIRRTGIRARVTDDGNVELPRPALLYLSFKYFMSQIKDEKGEFLAVWEHHEEWCDLLEHSPLLCLLAPRDHGKSYTVISYMLWRAWRHNRSPFTGELLDAMPDGRYETLYFSDTLTQIGERMETLQSLVLANPDLFGDMQPDMRRSKTALRTSWSTRRIRFKNGWELRTRAWKTSTRGAHPQMIVLDDVLNETNTLTQYQRDKTWKYFSGTVMPMNPEKIIVIGTAFHYGDLLHLLKPDKRKAPLVVHGRRVRFVWRKYRAVNWDSGEVLWRERHGIEELEGLRDADAITFSREYQNDPRDDASSLFPTTLTEPAIKAGSAFGFEATTLLRPSQFFELPMGERPPAYRKQDIGEFVVASSDMALSEKAGADYCVVNVGSFNVRTMQKRLLWAIRGRGWGFEEQVQALRMAGALFPIDLGVMEHNSFQRWVHEETTKWPETAGKFVGHNTGPEKQTMAEGVPGLIISLSQHQWTWPSGSKESLRYARILQTEASAFGWKDGKLQGVGEHDDTVMTWWLLERATRMILTMLKLGAEEQWVGMEDVGIERVQIGTWDSPLAR